MVSYLLKPRPPGGMGIALALIVIGGIMVLASLASPSAVVRVIGIILALLGVALLLVIIWGMRRRRVWVTFDDEGYTVEGPRGEFSGSWIDITDVAVSRKTAKIRLSHGPNRRTIIAHPGRVMDDEFMKVREGIRNHLEALEA